MNLYHHWWLFERIPFLVLRNSHKNCKYLFSFCGENCHIQSWVVLCTTIQQLHLRIAKLFSWIFFLYILVTHSIHTNSSLKRIENKSDAINTILFKEIFLSHFKLGMRSHSKVLWWYWDYLGGLDTNYIRCLTVVVYYVDVGPAVSTRFSTRAWFLHHCSLDLGYNDTALGWPGVLGGWRMHLVCSPSSHMLIQAFLNSTLFYPILYQTRKTTTSFRARYLKWWATRGPSNVQEATIHFL
jgi:hypothetical protein